MTSQNELEILQKKQDNLEFTRKNGELFATIFSQLLNNDKNTEEITTEEEKQKAAYALNLCTVSVSQIVEYNDINFLEREYEAILNNLNLEEMPKDEALLKILKQLLDVITFFRIQESEKKLLEKEYQQKMKNAIWNAIPNFGLIVAGGNPITMAVSLASQVGIGYMNYRKEKAKIGLDQERKEWELQRSAIEQFNGLRRELFDTAWRLADKYQFKDEYRLTERQIAQYNRILMDPDDLRRYERLDYIKDKFEAYPPFWYYLGSAANAVYQNADIYEEKVRDEYKAYAKEAFEKFRNSTKRNLLREDQLAASCALEYFDLLDNDEMDKKLDLLDSAQKASGNAFDVLELCALSYWKTGQIDKAAELFRMLVNEGYNTIVNAQLLSGIYVSKAICEGSAESRKMYHTLESRVGAEHLFPMPTPNVWNSDYLQDCFIEEQRDNLKEKYSSVLTKFILKYADAYDTLCKTDGNISKEMVELLDGMCKSIETISPDEHAFLQPIQDAIARQRKDFQAMLICDKIGGQRTPILSFRDIVSAAYVTLAKRIFQRIEKMDSVYLISKADYELEQFCIENELQIKNTSQSTPLAVGRKSIAFTIFDDKFDVQQNRSQKIEECQEIVKRITNNKPILMENAKRANVFFYIRGEHYFDDYIKKNMDVLNSNYETVTTIIAIINDRSYRDQDLIISTGGVFLLEGKKRYAYLSYSELSECYSQNEIKFGRYTYKNTSVDMSVLHELTNELSKIYRKYEKTSDKQMIYLIETVKAIIQYGSLSAKKEKVDIKGILHVSNPELINLSGNSSYVVIAKVIRGPVLVGGYCSIEGQSDLYQIIRIGYDNISEIRADEGTQSKFELRKIKGTN